MTGLEQVIDELRAFVAERDWAQFHDPKNLAMAVSSEAGELLAEYRWISGGEADHWSREAGNLSRVTAEAADVAIALLLFCDRVGIDLVNAVGNKIETNRANYPVKASKGRHSRPARTTHN
jgi:NTP pyrophosphatase (non-canonical NTP hydrolase)